ncbi:MAG: glycosyltransferase family 9 protein [Bacteroidaceae bacterium]|nr:glycosyltransferase family 9 protein [Bacteroidaceae bacterium]
MNNLLVIRLSSIGDVAATTPIIDSMARQYPDLKITVLTAKRCTAFFDWMPSNVSTIGINTDDYKGMKGLNRLYRELRAQGFDAVADLHDVMRTKYLKWRFRLGGVKVRVIHKGRASKHALLGHGNTGKQLQPTVERYLDVFRKLGLNIIPDFISAFDKSTVDYEVIDNIVGKKKEGERWVGIAPFAAHEGKIFPLDRMSLVAKILAERGCRVFLFGAGTRENEILTKWEGNGVMNTVGKMGGFHNEILLMSELDCMVSMDSANMHLASMVDVPVVSVWGATHPKAGFLGWRQKPSSIVQLDLRCRPCSIYGKKECKYGDYRCLAYLPKERILRHVYRILGMDDKLMADSVVDDRIFNVEDQ